MNNENEYREIFLAEALENYEDLNRLMTELEKNPNDLKVIDALFRITHTLKGNAMGLGFEGISQIGHVMEDVFSEAKEGKIYLDNELFEILFKTNDKLGELIEALKTGEEVKYKGIKTKLEVFLRNLKKGEEQQSNNRSIVENEVSLPNMEIKDTVEHDEVLQPKIAFSDLVQIPVRKLDNLLNLVGELVIERDSLMAKGVERGQSFSDYARIQRITSDLQYGVMDVRLVQIGFLFNKFHRVLRDAAAIEGKNAQLILEGTEIEIDRNILKIMSDSLVHIIRNSVAHGIEKPEVRRLRGKSETGRVGLKASNEKDTVIIEISDDGNGIDVERIREKAVAKKILMKEYAARLSEEEILQIIFEPGFSNSDVVTEVSGRGVGMDVVKKATESVGGKVSIKTILGLGTTICLHLPSSMAVKGALLFMLDNQEYAVALTYTEAVISLKKKDLWRVSGGVLGKYLGKSISIIFLKDLFALEDLDSIVLGLSNDIFHKSFHEYPDNQKIEVMVVSYNNKLFGLVVDKLLQQKEIVEKTLSKPLDQIGLFSGATLLGNGNVCLVLDIATIANTFFKEKYSQKSFV